MQAGFPLQDITLSFDRSQSPEKAKFPNRRFVHVPPIGERVLPSAQRPLEFDDENRAGMKRTLQFSNCEISARPSKKESSDAMDIEQEFPEEFEKDLDLDYNTALSINEEMLISIASGYSNPTMIRIPHCRNLSDAAFAQIFEGKSSLRYIELLFCGDRLTDKTLLTISKNCPDLTTLILTADFTLNIETLTDAGIVAIFNACPNLDTLCIGSFPAVTGTAFNVLNPRVCLLREVVFTGSSYCTEDNFEVLVKACPCLERLDIARCTHLTDRWLDLLAYYSQNLKALSIGRESGVSEMAIHAILKKLPDLSVSEIYPGF